MWIRRIAVRDWRGLDDLALDDLAPGLNLIAGPNESGKSRLVQALRFALFESAKGKAKHKAALATWGTGAPRPRVEVDLELDGRSVRIEKTFLGTGTHTVLRGAGAKLQDDDAEAQLASLLGVREPGRSETAAADRGLWPLLWVEQGASFAAPTEGAGDDARRRLEDVLRDEVGEVTAGEAGRALLERAAQEFRRYWTPGRVQATGDLRAQTERVDALRGEVDRAREARDAVARDADRLDEVLRTERDLRTRVAALETDLKAARDRREQARSARAALELAQQRARAAEADVERARERLAGREALAERLAQREATLEDLRAAWRRAGEQVEAAGVEVGVADAAVRSAESALDAGAERVRTLRATVEAQRAGTELRALRERLARARELREALDAVDQALARIPRIDREALRRLRAGREAVAQAAARLEGASARLVVHALAPLSVDGAALEPGAEALFVVDADRTIDLDGIARLSLRPGAGALPQLRDQVRDGEAALAAQLADLGVADVDAAERAYELRRERTAERERLREALEGWAPEGPAALEQAERALATRHRELVDRTSGRGAGDGSRAPGREAPEPDPGAALGAAETAEREARRALDAARQCRDAVRERLQDAQAEAGTLRARTEDAAGEVERARAELDGLPPRAEAEGALEAARAALVRAVEDRDRADEAWRALGGEDSELEVEQTAKALEGLRERVAETGKEIFALRDRIRAAGDSARHEHLQELEVELERAEGELARTRRAADAARRLAEVLDDEARQAQERLLAPLAARIGPYLADLFPNTQVWLGEGLALEGLRGAGAEEPFEALSGGAREQLGLIVRIGLAEVLAAGGEPRPLVLDDALVNTDPERIRRLRHLLYRASRTVQILLFTCHERLFDGLGEDRRFTLPARNRVGAAS